MGLMLFFNCVTEVPAFHFQSVILERLPVPLVFNGSMLLLALRLVGYGLLPLLHSPWPVLVLELLHGEWQTVVSTSSKLVRDEWTWR
jgi:hypothetical protein